MKNQTENTDNNRVLVRTEHLVKYFPVRNTLFTRGKTCVKAVDKVNLIIHKGETLGLVGESGCGKTTVGRCLLRLVEPTDGTVWFDGINMTALGKNELRSLRKEMQLIFQDPFSSLNPRMTAGAIIGEALCIHGIAYGNEKIDRVRELLAIVGLDPAHAKRYPHEFSGGQRQRIGIARALALNPKFIVADEPVSALDVSIQAQIINLLLRLQEMLELTYLFISHDLGVVKHMADRVAVMYLGKIVEMAPSTEMYQSPLHPYTQILLSAVPRPSLHRKRKKINVSGDVPSPVKPPPGCAFHLRCPSVMDVCKTMEPELLQSETNHHVACHIVNN